MKKTLKNGDSFGELALLSPEEHAAGDVGIAREVGLVPPERLPLEVLLDAADHIHYHAYVLVEGFSYKVMLCAELPSCKLFNVIRLLSPLERGVTKLFCYLWVLADSSMLCIP